MCGRYVNITKVTAIEKRFNVKAEKPEDYRQNTNVSTGQFAPVIANDDPNALQFFKFGFTPFWAKKQFYVINARSEGDFNKEDDPRYSGSMGIVKKPMFRKSIREKRCLVVADAFIEGPKKEKLNEPYVIYKKDGDRPFALAGIWDEWINQETGEVIRSFAIITTVSNSITQQIKHHRSPVMLDREQESLWLDTQIPLADVTSMLKPYPGTELNAYPVSTDIKSPRNHGPELLKPVGERLNKEYEYLIYNDLKLEGMGQTQARKRKNGE